MFIKRSTFNTLTRERDEANDDKKRAVIQRDKATDQLNQLRDELEIYKQRYDNLFDSVKGDLPNDLTREKLSPEQVSADSLASKYTDVKDRVPSSNDNSIGEVSAVIYGAGMKESLEARKKSNGAVKKQITVVVDQHDDCYAIGHWGDLDDDYDHIIDNFNCSKLNNVYVLDIDLPKFKPHTIKS
jgi:hypothetical protein